MTGRNFKYEVGEGDAAQCFEFTRPSFKVMKLVSNFLGEDDILGGAMALATNTVLNAEGLQGDPAVVTAVCYELYKEVLESMPNFSLEDKGSQWVGENEGEAVEIKKPSMEAIKLASRAGLTSKMLAGECLLADGLPSSSPIWQDGILFAALCMQVEKAFNASLPKVRRISLGER